ncbi:ABC transporter ATP-binding protein [Planctomonas deserti]|uniref:ABC transporter ATP-binding protein n=1 Tax=Planctomonas deserti TaxID=2144185 RepID=UPI000D346516|nr:ABC transporter ATP-binding protein [Planctomonas deserti]
MGEGIEVVGVSRSFSAVQAVRSVTLTAEPGSITALIGPNGSGKTTLLLMLATLLRPDAGHIRVAGHDPVRQPDEVRARMGWMPDILGSWASLPVRATLEIAGRMYRLPKSAARRRAEELLELVGLTELAAQPTRVLSRGQKQRLSLARALVHDPSVLLLDEPASGLDPAARVDLRVLLQRLAEDGRTVLVSSHVLAELDEMATSAVYLDAGVSVSAERIAASRAGLRPWRVRSLGADPAAADGADSTALADALRAVGVPAERISADHLGLLVGVRDEGDAAALLAALVTRGVAVSSFAPAFGELEQTFLDLHRGNRS